MATFTGLETVNNVTNYVVRHTSNQGQVEYINGVGYSVNNPYYTCPANTYAKVIIKYYNATGTLYYGTAPGAYTDGLIGMPIDFGVSSASTTTYDKHYTGNVSSGGGMGSSALELFLMPGEKIMRNNGTSGSAAFIWFQVIEYAIP